MNLSQIIERKKEEFEIIADKQIFTIDGKRGTLKNTYIYEAIISFIEGSIRESVEEALREVIVFKKTGTMAYMQGYEDALKDLYVRVKEFMK